MANQSLWGELKLDDSIVPPVMLLKEQASLLTELTKGVVVGSVIAFNSQWGGEFGIRLDVVAPALSNYSASLISISHPITPLPGANLGTSNGRPSRDVSYEGDSRHTDRRYFGPCKHSRTHQRADCAEQSPVEVATWPAMLPPFADDFCGPHGRNAPS